MSFSDFPLRILIIEDNQDLARLFADLIEVLGCSCETASTGSAGLKLALETVPQLIFSDLNMPGEKNGFDVAREIRANADFAATWLIAVTGFNDAMNQQEAKAAGFDRIFGKPIKFAQLNQLLNEYRQQMPSTE